VKVVLYGSEQAARDLFNSSNGNTVSKPKDHEDGNSQVEKELGTQDGFKMWRDSTGAFSIRAKFCRVEGESVVLRKADSSTISVRFERLSKEDQDCVLQTLKEHKREIDTAAQRAKAENEAAAQKLKREADARAKDGRIAKLLDGTIALDKFLKDERALSTTDPSLTQIQNQAKNQREREAFIKSMEGKVVAGVLTVSEVENFGFNKRNERICQVWCRGCALDYFFVSSQVAETLNKGSVVVVKWTAATQSKDRMPSQIDSLWLLHAPTEVIVVSKQ
jgi:hypothetical protein